MEMATTPRSSSKAPLEWMRDVALPIATALMTVTLPLIVGLYRDVGRLEEKLASLDMRWSDKIDNASRQAQSANEKADAILGIVNRVNERITERESDPITLLAKLGVQAQAGVVSAVINGEVLLFPKDAAAKTLLIKEGYVAKQVGPAVTGFAVPKARDVQ
jgi:hypothetical protein